MSNHNLIFILCGPSGSGKDTLLKSVIDIFPNVCLPQSLTTRQKRITESSPKTYKYVTEKQFKQAIDNGELLEWVREHNHYYGTLKSSFELSLRSGNVMMVLEPIGAQSVKKLFPNQAFIIGIIPESIEELERRITTDKSRGEIIKKDLQARIKDAKSEFEFAKHCDITIINSSNNFGKAHNELVEFIKLKSGQLTK